MSDTNSFFSDLVASMPSGSEWYINVSEMHRDFFDAISGIPYEKQVTSIKLILRDEYREQLKALAHADLHEHVQRATILWEGRKIFEAYDGFEIGIASKTFDINNTPLMVHLGQDILYISDEW